jgi:hypothetical protein
MLWTVQTFTFFIYVHHALPSLQVQFLCTLQKFYNLFLGMWLIFFNIFALIYINKRTSAICVWLLMQGNILFGETMLAMWYVSIMSLLMNYKLVAQCIGEISLTQGVSQWKKSSRNKWIVLKSHFIKETVFNLGMGMYVSFLVYVMMLYQLHSVKSEMTKWLYILTWKGHGRWQVWHTRP